MMDFTKDELSLISIYNTGDRKGTMEEIEDIRTYLEDDEVELADLTASVLRKLDNISDEEFDSLDLYPDFEDDIALGI
ncbi:MAG: transposon-transfer assisting family protein [Clostridia bacterium]|nr:transposon-transfer assisting family protein [Clostridia bacterium]